MSNKRELARIHNDEYARKKQVAEATRCPVIKAIAPDEKQAVGRTIRERRNGEIILIGSGDVGRIFAREQIDDMRVKLLEKEVTHQEIDIRSTYPRSYLARR